MQFKDRSIKDLKKIIKGKKAEINILKREGKLRGLSNLVGMIEGLELAIKFIR